MKEPWVLKTSEILGQNSMISRTGKMVVWEVLFYATPIPPPHDPALDPGRLSGPWAESSWMTLATEVGNLYVLLYGKAVSLGDPGSTSRATQVGPNSPPDLALMSKWPVFTPRLVRPPAQCLALSMCSINGSWHCVLSVFLGGLCRGLRPRQREAG